MDDRNEHDKTYDTVKSADKLLNLIIYFKNGKYYKDIFFITCLLFLCFTTIYIGAVPTNIFGHDIFFLLDNSWRVVNGQRPHLDYTSAWGSLTFVIFALGLTRYLIILQTALDTVMQFLGLLLAYGLTV